MVSKGGDTNRNASRRCSSEGYESRFMVVRIKKRLFDVLKKLATCHQKLAGLLKNGSIFGMRSHDCKYDLLG